ncbi:sigma D regulator [Vibrio sp. JC009]|uniref:sigma D regulator n=1 Tax=Vibrio sp. JC009 TaxID=2912314 RepID=UPI0023B10DE1|nr:sigma D regulator [Vibrio sp. JC009]WED21700.1 sigma D regulator [Vibrio sp. JC009]
MVMLNKFKKTQEQWGGSSEVIDHWLETRQKLVVEYCGLATATSLPAPADLQAFCQTLVDYISEGHFKIYEMVMDKWKSTGFSPTEEIDHTYGRIVLTTDPLLNFTDKYASIHEEDTMEIFDSDFSLIGEILETRFAVEDQLIQLIADSLAVPPGA